MYRRRRVVVGVLGVIVLTLLVLGVYLLVQAVQGVREGLSAPPPVVETADPTAPGPEGDAAEGACPTDAISIAAETNEEQYEPGEEPEFTIEVMNGHAADCIIDVGTNRQEFTVLSEGDTVWSSHYCAVEDDETAENPLVFPAQSAKTTGLVWNRLPVDSDCQQVGETFPAGDYELVVQLGDEKSDPAPFTLIQDESEATEEPEDSSDANEADESEGSED